MLIQFGCILFELFHVIGDLVLSSSVGDSCFISKFKLVKIGLNEVSRI